MYVSGSKEPIDALFSCVKGDPADPGQSPGQSRQAAFPRSLLSPSSPLTPSTGEAAYKPRWQKHASGGGRGTLSCCVQGPLRAAMLCTVLSSQAAAFTMPK